MSQNVIYLKNQISDNNDKEINKVINKHPRLIKIKKRAKILKKEEKYKDIALSSLLDVASKELGFKHWHEAYTNIKNRYYPKSYKLTDFYSFGLSQPKNMTDGFHIGHNSHINMNLWVSHKNLLQHTTLFGEVNERKKLHSYVLKQALKNNYSLILIENSSLVEELELYMTEENIKSDVYKLKVITKEEYLDSSHKDKIEKTTANLLNGYIEQVLVEIFRTQTLENFTENEKKQISELGEIVFASFSSKNNKDRTKLNSYSKSEYYQMIKETIRFEHILKEYIDKTFIEGYVTSNGNKGTFPQMHSNIKTYLYSLEGFDEHDINDSVKQQHDKLKQPLIDYLDYLENNLYVYFESENTIDINTPKFDRPHIYSISISEPLLKYDKPIIPHIMTHILYKSSHLVSMFRNIDKDVFKKDVPPIEDKAIYLIKDIPLLPNFDQFLQVAKQLNTSLIFSYEKEGEEYMKYYRPAFCSSQFISCESKKSIIENIPDQKKLENKYHEDNLYMYYTDYKFSEEEMYQPLVLDLKKFSEEALLQKSVKKLKD